MRLAIITTHPIQYYAPLFKLLHQRGVIQIKVFYTIGQQDGGMHDRGFNLTINWDIPLLEGYPFAWVQNTSAKPGSYHFKGIVNPDLVKQIEEWKPEAVLIYGWAYDGHLKALRYFKNKLPVYFRGDSTLLNEPAGIKKILRSIFLRWVYKHVDHAFYVGASNKAYFKKYGLKEDQLSFAPHAIDNERFKTDRSDEIAELRSSLKIAVEDVVVLYAGKFEPVKNAGLLLSAFIKLNVPDVHLLLVGNGVDESSLKAQAEESKKADHIHFLPFKNQTYMPVLYQAADLFCLPSASETWGLAVNEAMACGTAVLTSDKCGCAADLIKTGKNGAIFKSGEVNDLLICLEQLTSNKKLLAGYGKQSSQIIESWNFLNTAQAIENKLIHE